MNTAVKELRSQLERFKNFLAQDPENIKLVGQVAEMHYQLGEFDDANALIDMALKKQPADSGLQFLKANVAMASGHAEVSVDLLQNLLDSGETAPAIHYNLAYALLYESRHAEALAQLDEIKDETEQMPEVALLRARVLHHLGDLQQAITSAEHYISVNPGSAETSGVLALLNYDEGHNDIAKKWAEQTLAANDSNLEALITLGSIAIDGQVEEEANKYFESAVEKHPTSGRAWSGMGLADMLGMDLDKAITDLTKAVKYMPNHIGTWHGLAWCQLIKDDIAGAKKSLQASMEIDHNFGESHGGLAVIDVLEGNLEDAKIKVKKALRLDPSSFSGRFAQSLLLDRSGDAEKAKKVIQQILGTKIGGDSETVQMKIAHHMKSPKVKGMVKRR